MDVMDDLSSSSGSGAARRRARHFEYYRRSFSQHFGLVPRAVGSVPSASDLRELGVRRNFRPAVAEVADRPLVGAAVLLGRARAIGRANVCTPVTWQTRMPSYASIK